MKLNPKSIKAEFINSTEDYTLKKILNSPALVYDGTRRAKTCKAVAFKDAAMLREVACKMIIFADILDELEKENKKILERNKND